jgi:hypothetical protein
MTQATTKGSAHPTPSADSAPAGPPSPPLEAPAPRPAAAQRWLVVALLYAALAFTAYRPSLAGGPISDDYGYLMNPWVTQLDLASLPELLDPRSQATVSLNNYAPVRPLLHGLEWRFLYDPADVLGTNRAYHLTNVAAHVLASLLLAALLVQVGLPFAAGTLGGALFLLHPANVEAVAWLCELWTPVALAFGLGALLAQRRRPALAVVLFALALLSKPQAVCVLPVALLRQWTWRRAPGGRRGAAWMAAWLLVFAAVTAAELVTFFDSASGSRTPVDPDWGIRLRTIFALAGRYLVMAASGWGISTFQEPPAARSWLDPWWLFGAAATGAIAALAIAALRRDREEAAFWAWGPAAFLPVSQVLPFLYTFADRYLYFMLPGLIGAVLLRGAALACGLDPARRRALAPVAVAGAVALAAGFGLWSHARAGIWVSEDAVLADAARRWPDGVPAHLLASRRSARAGDVDAAVASLEVARSRGWDYYNFLRQHPDFEAIRNTPRFRALIREFAGDVVANASRHGRLTQADLRDIAEAHRLRGEYELAIETLERAIALGGPLTPQLRPQLARLRLEAEREAP